MPDLSRFTKATSQVDENLTWIGLRRYKIEKGRYQLELKGSLSDGKLLPRKTKLSRWLKKSWQAVSPADLKEKYDFEVAISGNEFTVFLTLPKGKFEGVLVAKIEGRPEEYPFQFEANESWPEPPPPSLERYLCDQCLEMNLGLNYISANHSNVSTLAPINYSAISVPSVQLQHRKKLSRLSGFRTGFSYNKGADFSPKLITMTTNTVALSTLSLSYERITKPNGVVLGGNYSSGYNYSLNAYSFPMVRVLSLPDSLYTIKTFNVYSGSVGGFFGMSFGESEMIAQMRFQIPLASAGLALKGGMSFDGAITYLGGAKPPSLTGSGAGATARGSYWGVTWGGQYHSYNYSIPSENLTAGSYSVFLSKIEAFLGYSF